MGSIVSYFIALSQYSTTPAHPAKLLQNSLYSRSKIFPLNNEAMEDTGKMLHEDHYFIVEWIYPDPPWRLIPDSHRMIKHFLSVRRLRTYPTALSAAVLGTWFESQAPHQ
jgi:hypothetical protein